MFILETCSVVWEFCSLRPATDGDQSGPSVLITVLIGLNQGSNQPDEFLLFWSISPAEEGTDLKMLDLTA